MQAFRVCELVRWQALNHKGHEGHEADSPTEKAFVVFVFFVVPDFFTGSEGLHYYRSGKVCAMASDAQPVPAAEIH